VCSVALAATLLRAPLDAQAFGSKTSQSLRDDAKEYKVELIGGSISGTIKVSSKLNRSSQETVTFDFSDVQGLAPSTKHGINIHDETGKSWNPELRNHGGPNSLKKFGASACHYVGDGCVLNRHYGDLGNIVVDGEGKIGNVKDMYVSLNENKDNFIGGKEFVIHEREDDFATEANDGNAGSVLAKGSIDAIN
jgi:Cu-Zn family superoxide dismutase